MNARHSHISIIALALLSLTACHRSMVQTVERRVVVHDTVRLAPEPAAPLYPLDPLVTRVMNDCAQQLRGSHTAFCIADLDNNAILTARDATVRMRTASVMKLVTAITALNTVSCYDSAFMTRVMTDGRNAWVRGGWDPLLSAADVKALATAARQSLSSQVTTGTRGMATGCPVALRLNGQDAARYGRGWCWDDNNPLLTPLFYAPMVDKRKRQPIAAAEQDFAEAFAREWRRAAAPRRTPTYVVGDTVTVASVVRPLAQVLAPMLKNSDNLMAEAVWRLTGESESARQKALSQVMAAASVDAGELTQADGSGLSLYNYASPLALVRLLFWADRQPFAPVLRNSLSLMGVDGTLKSRRIHGARVEAKTGTVDGVITLAGYMNLIDGRRLAFAIMNNGTADKGQARAAADRMLESISEALQSGN